MNLHPVVLHWLIAELLWATFAPVFVLARRWDDYTPILEAVNKTDCHPCVVRIDGWSLSVLTPETAARSPYLNAPDED